MISAVSSASQIYAVYFRTQPRTSVADVACIQATNLDSAKAQAKAAVAKRHPDGCVIGVCLAKDSPYPLIDAAGNLVPSSKA